MPIESIITCPAPSVADIFVYNGSLDVSITSIFVNGIPVTYGSGTNFPIPAGDNGSFLTSQTGTNEIVSISWSNSISGQNITFYDSSLFATCQDVASGGGSFSVFSANVTSGVSPQVYASDGACF